MMTNLALDLARLLTRQAPTFIVDNINMIQSDGKGGIVVEGEVRQLPAPDD